jgi:hypothetical protein
MPTEAPKNKVEFYRRYLAGEFGNRPRTWASRDELAASDYEGRVTIRSVDRSGRCLFNVPVGHALNVTENCRFNESMPDDKLLIQGEVCLRPDGLWLTFSQEKGLTMREAMQAPHTARNSTAHRLLQKHMDASSYDDIMAMLLKYGDAAIEFGTYAVKVGNCPNRNTVIWEVRNY